MTSADLAKRGFGGWMLFNRQREAGVLAALPTKPGVYCIRCTTDRYTLATGTSDILYIGSAANAQGLRLLVRQYFHPGPTQHTNKRILTRCGDASSYELGFAVAATPHAAKALESELLDHFLQEHGQLPPENRQPGRMAPNPKPSADPGKARRMFEAVTDAPMSPRTRAILEQFVARGDCEGMLRFLERCITTQRDVGRSIQAAGRVSFESRIGEMKRIFDE
jgi:hypothetical protein